MDRKINERLGKTARRIERELARRMTDLTDQALKGSLWEGQLKTGQRKTDEPAN